VRGWAERNANVGLKTRNHPCVDIDAEDAAFAADVQANALMTLGPAPVRTRSNSAKRALLYSAAAPFPKQKYVFTRDTGERMERCAVEVLGDGQQTHIWGTHPSGTVLEWNTGTPQPTTSITREQVAEFLTSLIPIAAAHGWALAQKHSPSSHGAVVDQATLRAPSIDALAEAVGCMPNDFDDRGDYIERLAAIKGAAGPEHEAEALEMALTWAAKWEGGNSPDVVKRDVESLHPPFALGWNFICDDAKRGGFNSAQYDFQVTDAEPVEVREAREGTEWARTATDAERIAAILGGAERPFYAEVGQLSGEGVASEWERLCVAALQCDPLRAVFRCEIMPAADKHRSRASEPDVFQIWLGAEIEDTLKKQSADDTRLLRRAAWVLVAPVAMLVGQAAVGPARLWRVGDQRDVKREWLVEGSMPRRGVGALVGPPANGKSWVLADFACQVARAIV
jgi:hypothetical protein